MPDGPPRTDFVDYDPAYPRAFEQLAQTVHSVLPDITIVEHVSQVAVVLYFDPVAEAAIRALAELLAASGFPNPIADRKLRPHITLAVCNGMDVARLRPELAEFAAETPRLACNLASLGVFPSDEGVIFLAPASSRALANVQEQMIDRLGHVGAQIGEYWIPGNWVTHCTLATGIQPQRIPAALAVCHAAFRPIGASLTRVSAVDMDSACDCHDFALMLSVR